MNRPRGAPGRRCGRSSLWPSMTRRQFAHTRLHAARRCRCGWSTRRRTSASTSSGSSMDRSIDGTYGLFDRLVRVRLNYKGGAGAAEFGTRLFSYYLQETCMQLQTSSDQSHYNCARPNIKTAFVLSPKTRPSFNSFLIFLAQHLRS